VLSPSVAGLDADKAGAGTAGAGDGGGARAAGRELSEAQMYQGMAGRMEIISPGDVTLAKFLGSGGYGEACRPPAAPPTASPRACHPVCRALLRDGDSLDVVGGGGSGCRRARPARRAAQPARPRCQAGVRARRSGAGQGPLRAARGRRGCRAAGAG